MSDSTYATVKTPFGSGCVVARGGRIVRFSMSSSTPPAGASQDSAGLRPIVKKLERYFAGRPVRFDEALGVDFAPFTAKVMSVVRGIPRGRTMSYAQVARAAGNPRAARAVGNAMRNNPVPIVVPCHRVVGSNGGLGGFQGGLDRKRRLLALEAGRA